MPTTHTANGSASPTDMTGQVLAEAARRMVPVLTGKLLTAIADQAVAKVDGLATRLDDYRDHGAARRDEPDAADPDTDPDTTEDAPKPSIASTALAFLTEQLRTALAIVVRLAAQALEMLRRATERLRARRAPEGIDAEAEALEEEDDDDIEGEYDLEYDDEDDEDERAVG